MTDEQKREISRKKMMAWRKKNSDRDKANAKRRYDKNPKEHNAVSKRWREKIQIKCAIATNDGMIDILNEWPNSIDTDVLVNSMLRDAEFLLKSG